MTSLNFAGASLTVSYCSKDLRPKIVNRKFEKLDIGK